MFRKLLMRAALELAIEAEERAYRYYDAMLSRYDEPEVRDIITKLRSAELSHRVKLEHAIATIGDDESLPGFSGDLLPAIDDAELSASDGAIDRVLSLAVDKEREAAAYYAELSRATRNGSLSTLFAALAAEETSHAGWVLELEGRRSR
jgi:rubrerythrin